MFLISEMIIFKQLQDQQKDRKREIKFKQIAYRHTKDNKCIVLYTRAI